VAILNGAIRQFGSGVSLEAASRSSVRGIDPALTVPDRELGSGSTSLDTAWTARRGYRDGTADCGKKGGRQCLPSFGPVVHPGVPSPHLGVSLSRARVSPIAALAPASVSRWSS